VIEYDDKKVKINSREIPSDELKGKTPCEYAFETMRLDYKKALTRQFDNIVVLSGAGTSVGIGIGDKVGKTMKGLWDSVSNTLGFENVKEFADKIGFHDIREDYTNLEELISRSMLAVEFLPEEQDNLNQTIAKIEKIIRDDCTLVLPENAPHSLFMRKITSRKLKYSRVKLFTLNYDLLFEQAASKGGYVLVDGFSYNSPRTFDGNNFDYDIVIRNNSRLISEDNYAPKVLHIYKPHGSLDWKRSEDEDNISFIKVFPNENPVMIYPSNSKFKYSYEQPFFEMIARFQQELRTKNTLLVSIGFSFYDLHIKTMINEAINTNPGLTVLVVNPDVGSNANYNGLKEKAKTMKNIILASETFLDFSKYFPYSDIYDYGEGRLDDESIRQ